MHRLAGQAAYRDMRSTTYAHPCRHPRSAHCVHSFPTMNSGQFRCITTKCSSMQPRGPATASANHLHCSVGTHKRRPGRPLAASVDHSTTVTTIHSTDSQGHNTHRLLNHQQLLDLGATFVNCWFTGIAKGPQAVEEPLSSIMDSDATLMADRVGLLEDKQASAAAVTWQQARHIASNIIMVLRLVQPSVVRHPTPGAFLNMTQTLISAGNIGIMQHSHTN